MPSTNSRKPSLLDRLRHDFSQFQFKKASLAHWSPESETVYYESTRSPHGKTVLLHELGHALLGHTQYHQDIQLLTYERAAWGAAQTLAKRYHVPLEESIIEVQLDTYRLWLHNRSRCPKCAQSGIQQQDLSYICLLCGHRWVANEARQCSLRRYQTNAKSTS